MTFVCDLQSIQAVEPIRNIQALQASMGCSLLQTRSWSSTFDGEIIGLQGVTPQKTVIPLETRTSARIPSKLKRCALVGSSALLTGKGHGLTIDTYDTVIRVNRLPTMRYFPDFGNKTSIFFTSSHQWHRDYLEMMGGEKTELDAPGADGLFSALVMTTWVPEPDWGEIAKHWQRMQYAVGHAAKWVMDLGFSFKAMKPGLPTTGLFAVLTFAPMCESLDLYGFGSGMRTADNHTMNLFHVHHLDEEHRLLDQIVDGTVTADDIVYHDEKQAEKAVNILAALHGKITRITA